MDEARASLARTPAVLRALLEGLPEAWLDACAEGPGTWSPREVACHLADLEEDAWIGRLRWILERGTAAPLPGVERERFRARYAGASLARVLDDFEDRRARNLRELAELRLDGRALEARGLHATLGEVTASQLLGTWVVHDLTHLAQIVRVLAAGRRNEVGPWVEFLSVLRPRST
ncbi:MAG TPA: DinB family protein [Longimicrobiales bacterium]|nr:DinB family protein [Longimicrobiales bacterium]